LYLRVPARVFVVTTVVQTVHIDVLVGSRRTGFILGVIRRLRFRVGATLAAAQVLL
jgi:hypothetical protein